MPDPLHKQGIAWTGPPLEHGPLPAFFYFALTGEESLHLDPYNQPIQQLKNHPIRCYSLTIPHHEAGAHPDASMHILREKSEENVDFVEPFIQEIISAVDFLIERDLIDLDQLYTGGLSRGGFIALHLAAQDPRFKAVLAYAPVIKFGKWNCEDLIESLGDKKVRIYIGNRDERVSTDLVYSFFRKLTEHKYSIGQRSPKAEMVISPSIGFKGHGTSPEVFRAGADWIASLSS